MAHVLIVEDDPRIRTLLMTSLGERGHAVASAATGMEGLNLAIETRPELVVLDLGLPDVDGAQVLSMLRAVSRVPVIVATARDDDPSLVACLDAGADDYVVKPYTAAQIEARIRAVLRRSGEGSGDRRRPLEVGGLAIDVPARQSRLDGRLLDLSPREFELLRHLAERAGEVVTKRELLTEVWQQAWGGSDKTVDVHLSWLRRKLGETASQPRYLHTVRGVGVRLSAPEDSSVRRRLIVTVAAAVSMVLLAMLVPMAVLLQDYALEDRLSRAALEVQATETVVSGDDRGDIAFYLATINEDPAIQTTVLLPDAEAIGPHPGEDSRVVQARLTGVARVDDIDGGAEILVPVSLGVTSGSPELTPVIRVIVNEPGLGSGIFRAWLVLAALGLALFVGALLLADRLGRSFVQPIQSLAGFARRLGDDQRPEPVVVDGPTEIRELGQALNRLVVRVEVLLARERENVSDLSHRLRTPVTALQLRIDSLPPTADRDRLAADLWDLRGMIDQIVREARRSEREGLVAESDGFAVLVERTRFWEPLAEDQGRPFSLTVSGTGPVPVRAVEEDLTAVLDVLLDNIFTHTAESAAVRVDVAPRPGGGLVLTVADDGPGFPAEAVARGSSAAGSSGLGLSIAEKTAVESGGRLTVSAAESGGAVVVVEPGAPLGRLSRRRTPTGVRP